MFAEAAPLLFGDSFEKRMNEHLESLKCFRRGGGQRYNSYGGQRGRNNFQRDVTLIAEHLPGVLNTIADEESRVMIDCSDCMLNPRIFSKIVQRWGPLEVDLFASRLTTQLNRFFSWRPDPAAEAWNAFSQDWSKLQGMGHANPPYDSCLQREDVELGADNIFSVAPGEGRKPIAILTDKHFEEVCNPTKYPHGKFGLASNRKVKLTVRKYFNQRLLDADGRLPRMLSIC